MCALRQKWESHTSASRRLPTAQLAQKTLDTGYRRATKAIQKMTELVTCPRCAAKEDHLHLLFCCLCGYTKKVVPEVAAAYRLHAAAIKKPPTNLETVTILLELGEPLPHDHA
jgi:ribosomal protein L37E